MTWTLVAPAAAAAFLASLVEVVEAFTVLLAVAIARGPRPALIGGAVGLALLALCVVGLGPLLVRLPIQVFQFAIGLLLLLFGMRWLRKAILRAAGLLPLHDETAVFDAERSRLRGAGRGGGFDGLAIATAAKAVLLEGLEVAFVVLAIGAKPGLLLPASLGAVAALVLVAGAGLLLHRPLARVPENALKFAVGAIVTAFGTFWLGEGLGAAWPGADLALPGLAAIVVACALGLVGALRRPRRMRRA
jgi:uncharacterized membrane protein